MNNRKLILWDWNGTLLNDVDVCVNSMNKMLSKRNMNSLDVNTYQKIFTFPVQNYYTALGFNFKEERFEDLSVEYIDLYKEHSKNTPLQDGAVDALEFFEKKGYMQVILSASEQNVLRSQIEERGIAKYFNRIIGLDNIHARSKLHNALYYMNQSGIDSDQITFIGDTYHDYEVANAIGCKCILLNNVHQKLDQYSYNGEVSFINNLKELLEKDFICS